MKAAGQDPFARWCSGSSSPSRQSEDHTTRRSSRGLLQEIGESVGQRRSSFARLAKRIRTTHQRPNLPIWLVTARRLGEKGLFRWEAKALHQAYVSSAGGICSGAMQAATFGEGFTALSSDTGAWILSLDLACPHRVIQGYC